MLRYTSKKENHPMVQRLSSGIYLLIVGIFAVGGFFSFPVTPACA